MSNQRLSDDKTKEYTALSDLSLLGLLYATGREWTSTISKESLSISDCPLTKGTFRGTRSIVLLSTLTSLLLVGAATITPDRLDYQASPEMVKTVELK